MIYDFSCSVFSSLAAKIMSALPSTLALLLLFASLSALGSWARRGKKFAPEDVFVGLGISLGILVLLATQWTGILFYAGVGLSIVLAICLVRAALLGYFRHVFWALVISLGLVMALAINMIGVFGWDAYAHWLPNALYVFHFNDLPSLVSPITHSDHASYPYGLALLSYIASIWAHGFIMQASAVFTFLFTLAASAMMAELPILNFKSGELEGHKAQKSSPLIKSGMIALALFCLTILNPDFGASLTFTNYADAPTTILAGILFIKLWQQIEIYRKESSFPHPWFDIAFISIGFVLIKQVNFILYGLLIAAFLVVALRNHVLVKALRELPKLLLPALAFNFIWSNYANHSIAQAGFTVLPLSQWHFNLVPQLLNAMTREALHKTGIFGLILVMLGLAICALPKPVTARSNFTLLAALGSIFYIGMLFASYIGSSFTVYEITTAASFYRYTTHVGMLGILFAWMAGLSVWQIEGRGLSLHKLRCKLESPKVANIIFVLVIVALPLTLALNPRLILRGAEPEACAARALATELLGQLPEGIKLAVIEPEETGFVGLMINFVMAAREKPNASNSVVVRDVNAQLPISNDDIQRELIDGSGVNGLFFHKASKDLENFHFGQSSISDSAKSDILLLKDASNKWQQLPF